MWGRIFRDIDNAWEIKKKKNARNSINCTFEEPNDGIKLHYKHLIFEWDNTINIGRKKTKICAA